MVREGEEGARGGRERAQGEARWWKEGGGGGKPEPGGAGFLLLFLHPSNHHNEKSECLKAMNKSMLGVRGGGETRVEQLVSLLTGLQSFFLKLYLLKHLKSAQSSSQWMK